MKLLIVCISWLSALAFHPLHLTVTDIELNPKNGSLEISQRVFMDDLEDAMNERYGKGRVDLYNPADPALLQELVGDFLQQHMRIKLNGRPEQPLYLGYEVEDDAIWAYFEVPKLRKLRQFEMEHTLFFNRFNDQTNLINVSAHDDLQSLKLDQDEPRGVLQWR
jgi:hypothetical protein